MKIEFAPELAAYSEELGFWFRVGLDHAYRLFGRWPPEGERRGILVRPAASKEPSCAIAATATDPCTVCLSEYCLSPFKESGDPAKAVADFVHEVAHLYFGPRNSAFIEALAITCELTVLEQIVSRLSSSPPLPPQLRGGVADRRALKLFRRYAKKRPERLRAYVPEPVPDCLSSPATWGQGRLFLCYRSESIFDDRGYCVDLGAMWLAVQMLRVQPMDWGRTVGIADALYLTVVTRPDGDEEWAWTVDVRALPEGVRAVADCFSPGARSRVVASQTEGWWPFRLWKGLTFRENGGWTTLLPAEDGKA